jgi:hypothetical protein
MGLLRACLVSALAVSVVSIVGAGCGGAVAPVSGDGGESSSSGGSSSGGSTDGGAPAQHDAAPKLDAYVTPEAPVGPCQVDGVPCITASQCCVGTCVNSICGG